MYRVMKFTDDKYGVQDIKTMKYVEPQRYKPFFGKPIIKGAAGTWCLASLVAKYCVMSYVEAVALCRELNDGEEAVAKERKMVEDAVEVSALLNES